MIHCTAGEGHRGMGEKKSGRNGSREAE